MTKDEARKWHQNTLRELIVMRLAGIKPAAELVMREQRARRSCLTLGACKCGDGIRVKRAAPPTFGERCAMAERAIKK